jgi:5-(carboxyamino)imidazole ribonucleotide synthase
MNKVYLPGATIGVMGGGQLGRMFAIAARRMGYRVHIFTPEENSPAGQFADLTRIADYTNEAAVRRFAKDVDVVTFEFENIPVETAEWCAELCDVRPPARSCTSRRIGCARKTSSPAQAFRLRPSAPSAALTSWNRRSSKSVARRS